jgi:hypothetical protein
LFAQDKFACNNFFWGICCQAVRAGQVDNAIFPAMDGKTSLLSFDCFARPVAYMLIQTGQEVKEGRLTYIGLAGQSEQRHSLTDNDRL